MFFKMLKKDLMSKKLLNITIFLFISAASVLLVTSVLHIYISTIGIKKAFEYENTSDVTVAVNSNISYRDNITESILKKLDENENVSDYVLREVINFKAGTVDFPDIDEETDEYLFHHNLFASKQPEKINLIYNSENKPFYVKNGCVALSINLKKALNLKIGDPIRLTTQMGYTYEFEISEFYKTCTNPYYDLIVLSVADYDIISGKSPCKYDWFDIHNDNMSQAIDMKVSLVDNTDHTSFLSTINNPDMMDNSDIVATVTSFMMVICVFMILIIFISIRFTLISAIKEEKKEIGMMRALGINLLYFKLIFAAKYISFAVVGGIVGIIAGIPLANKLSGEFAPNAIISHTSWLVAIGFITVAAFIAVMIIYTLLVMRSINKISVIDVIHGDCKGERFRKSKNIYLHKRKKMSLPFFMALSDLLNGFKRYVLLMLVYSAGIMIILFGVHLKNTLCSKEYQKYFLTNNLDFMIKYCDESWDKYRQKYGSDWAVNDQINLELKEAGIPAEIKYEYTCFGKLILPGGSEKESLCYTGKYDKSKLKYRKGGTAPLLENEIAISSYTAKLYNLSVGDSVSVEVPEYLDDMITTQEMTREYIITGIVDLMESSYTKILFGDEYEKAEKTGVEIIECNIYAPEKMKNKYVIQIKQMYDGYTLFSGDEYITHCIAYIMPTINLLRITVFIMAIVVMICVTVMHYSVLSNEDISFIAMLKSMGVGNSFIKQWQMIRTGILIILSSVSGNILMNTVGNMIAERIFYLKLGLSGFRFVVNPIDAYIIVPCIVILIIMVLMRIILRSVNKINIRSMNEE